MTDDEVVRLKQTHRSLRDKKQADRIKAVLMLNQGFTYSQVVKALLLDETTLRRYLNQYQENGLDGLLKCHYKGSQTRLTLAQKKELKVFLKDQALRTAQEVAWHIQKTYKVTYSLTGVTKLLHRLGFVYKKPKIVPGKADREKQEEFVKVYKNIRENLGSNDQLYFADSTHPQHNTKPSYGWILKGKDNDKFVKTNTGRERLNLNGALSLKGKTAVVLEEKTINSNATIRLFKRLERKHPRGKIYLILDNARYHHSRVVKAWLKKHRRFKLLFLPPYSPNLNLIERLWRFFHQKVTWNHYFETFQEFRKVTLNFFKHLHRFRPELESLLTDSFQLVPNLNMQT